MLLLQRRVWIIKRSSKNFESGIKTKTPGISQQMQTISYTLQKVTYTVILNYNYSVISQTMCIDVKNSHHHKFYKKALHHMKTTYSPDRNMTI
jgi:hypothetical protein